MARADIEEIIRNFEFLDAWEDRYKYVIELGENLPSLIDSEKTPETRVNGCVSQVWLVTELDNRDGEPVIRLKGDSDAHIVRGLVAITIALYSGMSPRDIADTNAEDTFQKIGLRDHLTPQRSNGLTALINRIKSDTARIGAA